jgi:hypothetical protein
MLRLGQVVARSSLGRARRDAAIDRWLWTTLAVGAGLALIVSYRVAHLSLVLGSPEGRWVYEYIYGFKPRLLVVCVGVFFASGALLILPSRWIRRREWWLVAIWLLVGTTAQLRLRALALYPIGRTFASDGSNGYYGATHQYPASVLLPNFDRLRSTLTIHPRSNMPGKLALVYGLERISQDPNVLARLVIVLSNLGGILLYLFVRELTGDPVIAMVSLAFYLFVPAKLFFFPVLNTITPLVVLACLYLWLRALRTHAMAYAVALGAALFVLLVYEPTPLVCGVIFVALAAGALCRGEVDWGVLIRHGAVTALTFVAMYLGMLVLTGFDVVGVFRHVLADAVEFNHAARRPYMIWVWRNLLDFGFGVGLCQALLLIVVLADGIRRTRGLRQEVWRDPMTIFNVSLVTTILITDVLGVSRGEVIRLWIFLACLAQIPAAAACVRLNNRAAALAVLATTLLIGTLGTSMLAFARP